MNPGSLDALLTLTLAPGLGPTLTRRALLALGSAEAVVNASVDTLARVQGIGLSRAQSLRVTLDDIRRSDALQREKERIEAQQITLLSLDDPNYPSLLKMIQDPPPVLYIRGQLQDNDSLSLGIVGSRKCSRYGREQTARFASGVAQSGMCIISGGAMGIDTVAHQAALRAGGRTIAVIGSGLANPYPGENRELFDQIVDGHGAVMSELPMTAPPRPENFPSRNRIVSGLSLGVLVIEAALRSGALITARLAAEEHHREVLALPGPVDSLTSEGCHKIIREGWATLVTNVTDVLDVLGETGQLLKAAAERETQQTDVGENSSESAASLFSNSTKTPSAATNVNLFTNASSDSQKKILEALSEPLDLDDLAAATGLAVSKLQADLTMLQLRGAIEKSSGKFHRRRRPHD